MQYYLGLDVGSATVKIALLNEMNQVVERKTIVHHGRLLDAVNKLLLDLEKQYETKHIFVLLTGVNGTQIMSEYWNEGDVPCIQKGLEVIAPTAKSAIEIGAQTARFLTDLGTHMPPKFAINENCAGGTGAFFEDQMYRLGLPLESYSELLEGAMSVPRLSGRCSVFAKTDIIHRQQEGTSTADILLGLCYATIKNLKATIVKNLNVEKPLALSGGILQNTGVIRAVKEVFDLNEEELIISEELIYVQAIGAAKLVQKKDNKLSLETLLQVLKEKQKEKSESDQISRCKPLVANEKTYVKDPICKPLTGNTICSLGIDVGSTSTNLVLLNDKGELVDFQYLRTKGDPQGVVKEGLASIKQRLGDLVEVGSVGVTGSGRYLIGKMVGADTIKDEITAQATAAICVDDQVDTVFEIGGQDSKYIQMKEKQIVDFQMNKICAAGTGSFVEEQAGRLSVPLHQYGALALGAKNPVDLGERCTVFIESNITQCMAKGVEVPDILAGICQSVIQNYLIKVVGNKHVGNCIMLQGGVCYNPAIVAAFQQVYGNCIQVSPYFSVSGAYGVGMLAALEIGSNLTKFRGFDLSKKEEQLDELKEQEVKINEMFYEKSKALLLDGYERVESVGKKTIGVPYVLVIHKFFPMIRNYFEALGYQVLLSPETNEEMIAASQQYAQVETCYPVKLIYGHMAWLAKKQVDYIFLPSILTMKHECSKVYHNYGCVYMQTAPQLIFQNMKLGEQGIQLLNPQFSLDFGQEAMAKAMIGTGNSLGKAKAVCAAALMKGAMAVRKYTAQVEKLGEQLLASLKPNDKVLVLITRTYGIEDPVLNMGIPKELLKRGYKLITLAHLPAHNVDISKEYENVYWPFGQHIISGVKLVANHPNLYAIYLTNHGCGPDGMLSHFVREEMGDKPYLQVEVDEHFSKVGMITRIEAFLSSLESRKSENVVDAKSYQALPMKEIVIGQKANPDVPLYLPFLYPYSNLLEKVLKPHFKQIACLPPTSEETLMLGRQITTSKEYLSFMALAGDVLAKAQEAKEPMQIVVPQTEGSEADGMYARVIYNYIKNHDQVQLLGPMIETLPFESKYYQEIFLAILAGDVILLANHKERPRLLEEMLKRETLTLDYVQTMAKRLIVNNEKKIAVLGDPWILYNRYLNHGVLDEMEQEGYQLAWMPLSEYLCTMWMRRAEEKKEKQIVAELEKQMPWVPLQVNEKSPLKNYAGSNGYYRMEKQATWNDCQAIISLSSMYENTQAILDLMQKPRQILTLSLGFEGTNHTGVTQKLQSFLYYMEKTQS